MLAAFIADTAAPSQIANTSYLWIWVVIGVITLIGFGIGGARWIRNQGKADAEQRAAEAEVERRLGEQDKVLAKLEHAIKPNGLDSQMIGDIAKRTENKVIAMDEKLDAANTKLDATITRLDQHIGAAEIQDREIWRELRKKADR